MPACLRVQAVSCRHPRQGLKEHTGRCKREPRLAYLCRIAELAGVLIAIARNLYAEDDFGVELEQTAYAFDSTTIDLCLSLFPWARFRKRKAAIKLHTLKDLRGSIPCFISITEGKTNDKIILDELILESGAFYIMDRGFY